MTQFQSLWSHLSLYSSYECLDFDLVSRKTTPFEQPHRLKLYNLHLRSMFDSEVYSVGHKIATTLLAAAGLYLCFLLLYLQLGSKQASDFIPLP